mgnify:FL=1
MQVRRYWVYILASHSRRLYVGSTSDLVMRLRQHRRGEGAAFCQRYCTNKLVHWEQAPTHREALARERQIKGWCRSKKMALIETANLGWLDLAADWSRASGPAEQVRRCAREGN